MVYVFGNLQQLRKFELAWLAISRPLPVPAPAHRNTQASRQTEFCSSTSFESASYSLSAEERSFSRASDSYSDLSGSSEVEDSSSSFESQEIEISHAYSDDVPAPEGPATATGLHRSHYRFAHSSSITFPAMAHIGKHTNPAVFPSPLECRASRWNVGNSSPVKPHSLEDASSFGPSAAFIRHEVDLDADFDFDLLPKFAKGNVNLADNNRLPRNASPPPVIVTIADHIPTPSLQTENPAPSSNLLTSAIARQHPIAQSSRAISDAEL
ncbi:hypothetical protein BDR05DRAFT_1004767 [Suillus weaverae]|nr:hypothetical protein BDR05DRAFT_1004767 [Suillus weaverae]